MAAPMLPWSWEKPGLDRTGLYRATFMSPLPLDPERPKGRSVAYITFEAATSQDAERIILAVDQFLKAEAGLVERVGEPQLIVVCSYCRLRLDSEAGLLKHPEPQCEAAKLAGQMATLQSGHAR